MRVKQRNRNSTPRSLTTEPKLFAIRLRLLPHRGPPPQCLVSPSLSPELVYPQIPPPFSCSSTKLKAFAIMPQVQAEIPPMEPGVGSTRPRVGGRFKGSWPRAAQAAGLPRATSRRELSSQSIVSFQLIRKTRLAWDSNIGQRQVLGGQTGPIPRTGGRTPGLPWSKATALTHCRWRNDSQRQDPGFPPACGSTDGIEWLADNRGEGRKVHIRTSQPLPGKNVVSGTGHTWVQILALSPSSASLSTWLNLSKPRVSYL